MDAIVSLLFLLAAAWVAATVSAMWGPLAKGNA